MKGPLGATKAELKQRRLQREKSIKPEGQAKAWEKEDECLEVYKQSEEQATLGC